LALFTSLQEKLVWTRVDAGVEKENDHGIKDMSYNEKIAEVGMLA